LVIVWAVTFKKPGKALQGSRVVRGWCEHADRRNDDQGQTCLLQRLKV